MNFLFADELSSIKEGKIFEKGGTKPFHSFAFQSTQFSTRANEITVQVQDQYGNTLNQDLNLEQF